MIEQAVNQQPVNKLFLTACQSAIEKKAFEDQRLPSQWYKPSSFVCLRQMYFMRTSQKPDETVKDYQGIGMADTGTRRHTAIQAVLVELNRLGFDWEYIDVGKYIEQKQTEGKCLSLVVREKVGAETKLFDKTLKMSFMCDGIVRRISTNRNYLFEFKNQISFKASNKSEKKDYSTPTKNRLNLLPVDEKHIDDEHQAQVDSYGTCLDLDEALVLYENRDTCELMCPEVYVITPEKKEAVINKIMCCEQFVEKLIVPPIHSDTKPCRWCDYKLLCRRTG